MEPNSLARLKTLFLLQGYEILVIVTAGIIFRRFKKLGDAFTLFLVELALLLDPTFFSNAFHTMPNVMETPIHVAWINAGCLALAGLKFLIMVQLLRLPIKLRAQIAFLFATGVVYLGEWPLNLLEGRVPLYDYFYLLGWVPLCLVFLYPSFKEVLQNNTSGHLTQRQERGLPIILLVLPLVIIMAHYIESIQVYFLQFFPRNFAPILLAGCILMIKNTKDKSALGSRLILNDCLCLSALWISLSMTNVSPKSSFDPYELNRSFIVNSNLSLILCSLAVGGQYLYFYHRLHTRAALHRIGILIVLAFLFIIHHFGIIAKGTGIANKGANTLMAFLQNHPAFILLFFWIILAGITYKFRRFSTWFVFGVYSMLLFVYLTPLKTVNWIPEQIQFTFTLLLILYHKYNVGKRDRNTAAVVVILTALCRFAADPAYGSAAIVGSEVIALILLGIFLKRFGYLCIGLLQFIASIAYIEWNLPHILPPALFALASAFILFALGIVVTFQKSAFLKWYDDATQKACVPIQEVKANKKEKSAFNLKTKNQG